LFELGASHGGPQDGNLGCNRSDKKEVLGRSKNQYFDVCMRCFSLLNVDDSVLNDAMHFNIESGLAFFC